MRYALPLALLLLATPGNATTSPGAARGGSALARRSRPPSAHGFSLPRPGSLAWSRLRDQLAADLHPEGGPGFSLLDLREHLSFGSTARDLRAAFSAPAQLDLRERSLLRPGGRSESFDTAQLGALAALPRWTERLVREALPAEGLRTTIAQLRLMRAGNGDAANVAFRRLHVDGGDLAALIAVDGLTTRVLADAPKLDPYSKGWPAIWARDGEASAVPDGHLLVMSGSDRGRRFSGVKPTVHGSPDAGDRALYLQRFGRSDASR